MGIAERYGNHLLERIEVAGDEVRLDARMANVLTIEAEKRKDGTVNQDGQSIPSIVLIGSSTGSHLVHNSQACEIATPLVVRF